MTGFTTPILVDGQRMRGFMAGNELASTLAANIRRFWRIYITANNGDSSLCIQEIELRGSVGGSDLTTPSTSISASANTTIFVASRAIDNDISNNQNVWDIDAWTAPAWIMVDFGVDTPVSEVGIAPQNFSGGPARAPKDFLIQWSPDAIKWTTVRSVVGATAWTTGAYNSYAL